MQFGHTLYVYQLPIEFCYIRTSDTSSTFRNTDTINCKYICLSQQHIFKSILSKFPTRNKAINFHWISFNSFFFSLFVCFDFSYWESQFLAHQKHCQFNLILVFLYFSFNKWNAKSSITSRPLRWADLDIKKNVYRAYSLISVNCFQQIFFH